MNQSLSSNDSHVLLLSFLVLMAMTWNKPRTLWISILYASDGETLVLTQILENTADYRFLSIPIPWSK
jgi:hypothetical protein